MMLKYLCSKSLIIILVNLQYICVYSNSLQNSNKMYNNTIIDNYKQCSTILNTSITKLDDYINIQDNDIIVRTYGIVSQIDFLNHIKMDKLLFSKIEHVQIFQRNNIPNRFHYINNNTTDIIIVANPGYYITNHKKQSKRPFDAKGMHGYDPQLKDMHAIFYAFGPNIVKNKQIKSFDNVHIYPLMCELLNIQPNQDGSELPQGDLNVLQPILKLNTKP